MGGDPKFKLGYLAMSSKINSRGGGWYKMEAYVRNRMKAKGAKGYMSVKPEYPSAAMHRPNKISVSALFNRKPYKVKFEIDTNTN